MPVWAFHIPLVDGKTQVLVSKGNRSAHCRQPCAKRFKQTPVLSAQISPMTPFKTEGFGGLGFEGIKGLELTISQEKWKVKRGHTKTTALKSNPELARLFGGRKGLLFRDHSACFIPKYQLHL